MGRKTIQWTALAAASVALTGFDLSAIARKAPPPPARVDAAANPLVATLPGGTSVEVLGVCDVDGEPAWWRVDGTPLAAAPTEFLGNRDRLRTAPEGTSKIEHWVVAFRITHPRPLAGHAVKADVVRHSASVWSMGSMTHTPQSMGIAGNPAADGAGETIHVAEIGGLATNTRADLELSIPGDAWETVEAIDAAGKVVGDDWVTRETTSKRPRYLDGLYVQWSTPGERDGAAFVEAFENFPDCDRAVIAIDADGVEHAGAAKQGGGVRTNGSFIHARTPALFPGLPLARVARFELRIRPRAIARFEAISLKPGTPTEPRVRLASDDGDGPADRAIVGAFDVDAGTLEEVFDDIEGVAGVRIDVPWAALAEYQAVRPESAVPGLTLMNPMPMTAVAAAFEAAGGRDYTLVVTPDGGTIRIVTGRGHVVHGDGRAFEPGRRR